MALAFKTIIFGLLTTVLLAGCQTTSHVARVDSVASTGSGFPVDRARAVLSFADTLESVLPSVVRIGNLQLDPKGEPRLAGLGSGAVIDADKGYGAV